MCYVILIFKIQDIEMHNKTNRALRFQNSIKSILLRFNQFLKTLLQFY